MTYPTHLLPTTVVGSYPQPDWLVDRATLHQHGVPRVHAHDMWRIPPEWLEQAQDDATILAIQELQKRQRPRRRRQPRPRPWPRRRSRPNPRRPAKKRKK